MTAYLHTLNEKELQRAVRQLSRLVKVSVTLNSTLDLAQLLRFIIQTAAELLECEAASILLYDEKQHELIFTAASGTDPEKLAQIPVPIEGSIAGTIFLKNQPLIINDVEKDPRHYSQVGAQIQFHPRSLLGVPMRIQDRVTGVLEALNKCNGDFSEPDVNILSIIASQAAVAIHNARLVQALQRAYDELSRVDKLKTDFMSIASHELRTPLGVILGYATFLKDEAQGELSEHAERVLNSAIRLRTLVEDLTNMNLLQMGTAKLDLKVTPIQQIIQTIFDEVAPTARAKGQQLILHLPPRSLYVRVDAEKLGSVFTNLLNNAIRFTPDRGKIEVAAQAKPKEVWVYVKDNGVGIPHNELDNIFHEFYQLEDHMRRRHGGLGLGLAIAHDLIELQEGRIWAESEGVGKGATFTVALPLAGSSGPISAAPSL
jgi:K+-sensing histidine kinase KdpD